MTMKRYGIWDMYKQEHVKRIGTKEVAWWPSIAEASEAMRVCGYKDTRDASRKGSAYVVEVR